VQYITSQDGTQIALDEIGNGAPIILIDGALGHRLDSNQQHLATLLSQHFTVINYDRRGRGDSKDTMPYTVQREIEDIEALIKHVGGSAYLYGMSSGAILALKATKQMPSRVTKLALYEPPFIIDSSRPPLPKNYIRDLENAIKHDDSDKAVEIFMTQAIGIPLEYLTPMREDPMWNDMKANSHTLAYDGRISQDLMLGKMWDTDMWAAITMPTYVIVGEATEDFIRQSGQTLVDELINGELITLTGQSHNVDMTVLAPTLIQSLS